MTAVERRGEDLDKKRLAGLLRQLIDDTHALDMRFIRGENVPQAEWAALADRKRALLRRIDHGPGQ